MRTFSILVTNPNDSNPKRRGKWLRYQPVDGPLAIKGMTQLAGRGMSVLAETTANEITERLTLEQMREAVIA